MGETKKKGTAPGRNALPPAGILKRPNPLPSSANSVSRSHTLPRNVTAMNSDDGINMKELPGVLNQPEDPRFRRAAPSSNSGSFVSLNDAALAAVNSFHFSFLNRFNH